MADTAPMSARELAEKLADQIIYFWGERAILVHRAAELSRLAATQDVDAMAVELYKAAIQPFQPLLWDQLSEATQKTFMNVARHVLASIAAAREQDAIEARDAIANKVRSISILREHAGKSLLENLEITRDAIADVVSDMEPAQLSAKASATASPSDAPPSRD